MNRKNQSTNMIAIWLCKQKFEKDVTDQSGMNIRFEIKLLFFRDSYIIWMKAWNKKCRKLYLKCFNPQNDSMKFVDV